MVSESRLKIARGNPTITQLCTPTYRVKVHINEHWKTSFHCHLLLFSAPLISPSVIQCCPAERGSPKQSPRHITPPSLHLRLP